MTVRALAAGGMESRQGSVMEQHEHDACARLLVAAIGADRAASTPPTAYLATSTRSNLRDIGSVVRAHPDIVVVGSLVESAMKPVQLLGALRRGEGPRQIIVFCDQLFGPDIATIPCERDGGQTFFSGLEPLLHAKYGYGLKAQFADTLQTLTAPGSIEAAIDLLRRYFQQASSLGAAWLAADQQAQRTLPGRVREARLRNGFLRSAIYHLYADQPLDAQGKAVLSQLDGIEQRLAEVAR